MRLSTVASIALFAGAASADLVNPMPFYDAATVGAATMTCQDVPAGKGGSLCPPPKKVCSPFGTPPDLSFKNSAYSFKTYADSLQRQCASFKQWPQFAIGACQQSCPEQAGLCYNQINRFSCNFTQDQFCAPYTQHVQDGGVICESDSDCGRAQLMCYDTCRECHDESYCDGGVFNRTIAPWGVKNCNTFTIYKPPSDAGTCEDCTRMYYSYCPATDSCFNAAADCNAVCGQKGAKCAQQFSQCPSQDTPCNQCHLANRAWCQDYNVCFESQSDCKNNCKECSLPSEACPKA